MANVVAQFKQAGEKQRLLNVFECRVKTWHKSRWLSPEQKLVSTEAAFNSSLRASGALETDMPNNATMNTFAPHNLTT